MVKVLLSLAVSLFADRFLGKFSRLNISASRASLVPMCAPCRVGYLALARPRRARPTAGNSTNECCTSRG